MCGRPRRRRRAQVREAVAGAGLELRSVEEIPFSLEDVFLALIDERRASPDKAA